MGAYPSESAKLYIRPSYKLSSSSQRVIIRQFFEVIFRLDRMIQASERTCRILPAGGLGVSPSFNNPPILGD